MANDKTWEDQYVSRSYYGTYNRHEVSIIDKYNQLRRIAEHLHVHSGSQVGDCINALATIDLQSEIHEMRKHTHEMHLQLMSQLEHTRSVERIINNERVVVGDLVNEAMAEVYKK